MTYDLLMPPEQEPLVIDRASIDALMNDQTALLGRPLTEEERSSVVERAIDDAVLLREAYKRGLDRDAVVERHLVQKMRFVLGEEVPEPSAVELRAYLAANRERYRGPPTVTLDHVFYADPAGVPGELLARLQNGRSIDGLGDPLSMLGDALPRYTVRDLMGLVGPVARRVFESPVGEWQGPARSERGVHFMRVAAHHPPSMPSFEELELSAPGLDPGPTTARGRRQARGTAPGLPARGRADSLISERARSAGRTHEAQSPKQSRNSGPPGSM